jgi:hypothetical protein
LAWLPRHEESTVKSYSYPVKALSYPLYFTFGAT